MSRFGIDEDWQRLTPQQLLAAGRTFAIGYVSEDNTGKNITGPEIQAYRDAGVSVLLVYEYSTTAIAGGAAKGRRDALIAIQHAEQVGYPVGCTIAFAIDQDTTTNPSSIDPYCGGFTNTCHDYGYKSMVYGGYSTVKDALNLGLADYAWQTYAWSGTPTLWDPRVAIRQVQNGAVIAGKQVDLDTAMIDDFGLWEAEMTTNIILDDPQAGEIYNANGWIYAISQLFKKATIAYGNNSSAVGDADVPFVVKFLALVDQVDAIQTTVTNLSSALTQLGQTVAGLSVTTLSDTERATIQGFTTAVEQLTAHLK